MSFASLRASVAPPWTLSGFTTKHTTASRLGYAIARQIADVKIHRRLTAFAVRRRFGIQPVDDRILNRVGKKMIARRTVMPDRIALHVLRERNVEILEIRRMHRLHIEIPD